MTAPTHRAPRLPAAARITAPEAVAAARTSVAAGLSCPPAAPVHAWMPSSPCGPSCVATPDSAGAVRTVARAAGVVGLLLSFPVVNLATPRSRRTRLHRRYAKAVLRCCGIGLRVVDLRGQQKAGDSDGTGAGRTHHGGAEVVSQPVIDAENPRSPQRRKRGAMRSRRDRHAVSPASNRRAEPSAVDAGVLVVAGHVGWADVLALAAVSPMGFVARGDLVAWPAIGRLARLMRVIPIDRERLRQLPQVVEAMAARLAAGERVGVFPEGTTWCGRAHGRLRPALFEAAVRAAAPVQPIRLRYLDRDGQVSTVPGFVGVDTFLDSVRRVLRAKGVVAEIVLLPIEDPGADRHDLARRCEQAIRGRDEVRIDEHATAVGTGPTREIVSAATVASTTGRQ